MFELKKYKTVLLKVSKSVCDKSLIQLFNTNTRKPNGFYL